MAGLKDAMNQEEKARAFDMILKIYDSSDSSNYIGSQVCAKIEFLKEFYAEKK